MTSRMRVISVVGMIAYALTGQAGAQEQGSIAVIGGSETEALPAPKQYEVRDRAVSREQNPDSVQESRDPDVKHRGHLGRAGHRLRDDGSPRSDQHVRV